MKVLLASTSIRGGAGIACRRLWQALQSRPDVTQCSLLFRERADLVCRTWRRADGVTTEFQLFKNPSEWPQEPSTKALNDDRSPFADTFISALEDASEYDKYILDLAQEHDIINLHWTSGLISVNCLRRLAETGKAVLISQHDTFYFTGGCHYPAGCRKFTDKCADCPQVQSEGSKTEILRQQTIKGEILSRENIFWTGPSDWIIKETSRSSIAKNNSDRILSACVNVVEEDLLEIEESSRVAGRATGDRAVRVALIADNLNDRRKGIDIGVQAIAEALKSQKNGPRFELHLAGSEDHVAEQQFNSLAPTVGASNHISVHRHGRLHPSDVIELLRKIDILVFPSLEENYSNLIIEALIQGTIVLAFGIGGNVEISKKYPCLVKTTKPMLSRENGVNPNNAQVVTKLNRALASLIQENLNAGVDDRDARRVARAAQEDHSAEKVVSAYTRLLEYCLEKAQSSMGAVPHVDYLTRSAASKSENKPRLIEHDEDPVYWLNNSNDSSILMNSQQLYMALALWPSWHAQALKENLNNADITWSTKKAVDSSNQALKELPHWDLHLIIGRSRKNSNVALNILNANSEPVPVLVEYIANLDLIPFREISQINQILWNAMLSTVILPPRSGLSRYFDLRFEETICAQKGIDAKITKNVASRPEEVSSQRGKTYLRLPAKQASSEIEPVIWLDSDSYLDVDLVSAKASLFLVAHYPSWDKEYLRARLDQDMLDIRDVLIIEEFEFAVDQLQHWDTAIIVASLKRASGHLFKDKNYGDLCLPVSRLSALLKPLEGEQAYMLLEDTNLLNMVDMIDFIAPTVTFSRLCRFWKDRSKVRL